MQYLECMTVTSPSTPWPSEWLIFADLFTQIKPFFEDQKMKDK